MRWRLLADADAGAACEMPVVLAFVLPLPATATAVISDLTQNCVNAGLLLLSATVGCGNTRVLSVQGTQQPMNDFLAGLSSVARELCICCIALIYVCEGPVAV